MAQLGYLITVTELRLDAENFKKSTGEAWSTYEKRVKKFDNQTIPPDPGPSPIPSNRPPDQSSPTSCCCNLAIELGVRAPGPWSVDLYACSPLHGSHTMYHVPCCYRDRTHALQRY